MSIQHHAAARIVTLQDHLTYTSVSETWIVVEFKKIFPFHSILVPPNLDMVKTFDHLIVILAQKSRPDPSGRGGGRHVYVNLHKDQFSSVCQIVSERCSPECHKAVNFLFFHWMLESWNFRHLKKKFGRFWAVGVSKLVKFFFEKMEKMMKFFSLFLFVLCPTNCIMFPGLGMIFEKYFLLL